MLKYDTELDFSINTSLTLIAQRIHPKSRVLEFGPATGYMTRYFKENLHCDVVAIELDPDSARLAAPYCSKMIVGNIDSYPWLEELSGQKFDHIIFSDVLEHLYDPWNALKKAATLLDTGGTMFTSIPNVAHSAIVMDLLKGNFEYQGTGLLDQTHIRFFTQKTVEKLIEQAELKTTEWLYTQCTPSQSEFRSHYNDFPPQVQDVLKNRTGAEVYQYVAVSKSVRDIPADFKPPRFGDQKLLGFDVPILASWFLNLKDEMLPYSSQLRVNGENNWTNYSVNLDMPFDVSFICFNPSNQSAICEIRNILFHLEDGSTYAVTLDRMDMQKGIVIGSEPKAGLRFISFGKTEIQFYVGEAKPTTIRSVSFEFKLNRDLNDVIDQTNTALQNMGRARSQPYHELNYLVENFPVYKNLAEQRAIEIEHLKVQIQMRENDNAIIGALRKIKRLIKK